MRIDEMRDVLRGIEAVWLIGARINDRRLAGTAWELLIFGDRKTLSGLSRIASPTKDEVRISVVTDGDKVVPVLGNARSGSLKAWRWVEKTAQVATYTDDASDRSETQFALRVR